jgi:hypothetical protein
MLFGHFCCGVAVLLYGSECICGYATAILMHTNIDCNYRYDNLGEQLWACHKESH